MRNFITIIVCFLAISLLSGCGKSRPKDMPQVYPVDITVIDGTTPLDKATIILVANDATAKSRPNNLVVGGVTDADGKVLLNTTMGTYSEKGAPLGQYKVTIQKDQPIVQTLSDEELQNMDMGARLAHSRKLMAERDAKPKLVPERLTQSRTTPLLLDVKEKDTVLEVDIAEHGKK